LPETAIDTPEQGARLPRELVLGPADLAERFPARCVPDVCIRCKAGDVKSWTFIGKDTVTGEAVYLCSECAGEVLGHAVTKK
jgi:hypothetical protein